MFYENITDLNIIEKFLSYLKIGEVNHWKAYVLLFSF